MGQWGWAVRLPGEVSFQAPCKRGQGLGREGVAVMDRGRRARGMDCRGAGLQKDQLVLGQNGSGAG